MTPSGTVGRKRVPPDQGLAGTARHSAIQGLATGRWHSEKTIIEEPAPMGKNAAASQQIRRSDSLQDSLCRTEQPGFGAHAMREHTVNRLI